MDNAQARELTVLALAETDAYVDPVAVVDVDVDDADDVVDVDHADGGNLNHHV